MAGVVSDVGEVEMIKRIVNLADNGDLVLHLFTNNYIPDENSVLGSFTEASVQGYAPITLEGSSWTVGTVGGVSEASHPQITFTLEEAVTCYGYYVTDLAGTGLIWCERFTEGGYQIPSGGGSIKITPKLRLS